MLIRDVGCHCRYYCDLFLHSVVALICRGDGWACWWVQQWWKNESWWCYEVQCSNYISVYADTCTHQLKLSRQFSHELMLISYVRWSFDATGTDAVHEWFLLVLCNLLPSVLWRCWLGGRKGIRTVKNWLVGCWRGYLSGVRCRFAYGPADTTATHYLLLQ